MGKLKIKLTSENQDANKHPDFGKGAFAQSLQIKYGILSMEKLEVPGNDLIIEIDIDKAQDGIDWSRIDFPNSTIKDQVEEIIYYTQIKSSIDRILNEIKRKGFDGRDELYSNSLPLISIIEDFKESEYFKELQNLNISGIVRDLKYTLEKEGTYLINMKENSSDRDKRDAIANFKNRIESALLVVNSALRHLTLGQIFRDQ